MKRLIKPVRLLFYALSILVFFFIGNFTDMLVEAGIYQVFASEGIVLFYGIIVAALAFLAAVYIAFYKHRPELILINRILGFLLVVIVFLVVFRASGLTDPEKNFKKNAKTPEETEKIELSYVDLFQAEKYLGIGFFKPNFYEYPTLYFYGNVNLEKSLLEHMPIDSVVFINNEFNEPTTSYAPPWLYPEHLKLDYGIIYFKVIGTGFDLLKVEANKLTGQVTYLDKNKGTFLSWPEFLMLNNSIKFNEKSDGKVYTKPFENAGQIPLQFELIKPLLIQNDWMYAKLVDEDLVENGKGWIRWKKENELLINYTLLF
jgi:hypothetical protein